MISLGKAGIPPTRGPNPGKSVRWWGWEKFRFRKFEVVSDFDQAFEGAV